MPQFSELRESRREPSFLRPIDTHIPPSPRHRTSRRHQASSRTWLPPTPEIPRKPPPPQPVPIPSPHIKARGIAELNQNFGQYADVDQGGPDLESGNVPVRGEGSPTHEEHDRSFVGGFMKGLRGLSRSMMRNHSPERNPAPPGSVLSGYESPGRPGSFYVQASMPVAEPEPAAIRQHHSPSRASHDHHGSLDFHDGDTTVVHHESPPSPLPIAPVAAEPRPSSDYAKMDSPLIDAPTDISLHSRLSSIQKFFRDLNELPWVATHIAADYIPGQAGSRRRMTRRHPIASWYSHDRRQSIDLLSGESSPTPATRHRRAFSGITPSPGAAYREGYRSSKTSHEPPVHPSEIHAFPKYPHGYAPAPQPALPLRYVTPPITGRGGTPPVVAAYPAYESGRSQYPYPISRPPTGKTS